MRISELETERIRLRQWRVEDLPTFADINRDPQVLEFLPSLLSRIESDAWANRITENIAKQGFGLWALEIIGGVSFAGYVGLSIPSFEAHFTPCVEIGWRLARKEWGKGYATEAAKKVLEFGFAELQLGEIVSFTVPSNTRSTAVMERIGMTHNPADDFDHPKLLSNNRLCRHVLYRATPSDDSVAV